MKRSKFLKILGLASIAPVAVIKALESKENIKPFEWDIDKGKLYEFVPDKTKVIKTDEGYRWYRQNELETQIMFEKKLEESIFNKN